MDNILNYSNFDILKTCLSDKDLRQNIRLLCVFGCGAAEVIYATSEDRVYAFGRNRFGGLGLGSVDCDVKEPQLNTILSYKHLTNISFGFEHWLALTAPGKCYSWGRNDSGQLGIGSLESIASPQFIDALAEEVVTQISCGGFHTMALTIGGQVYSWGENKFGQLGDNSFNSHLSPVKISIVEEVVSISCGKRHSLALTSSGEVYIWGINGYGQCGLPPTKYENITIPTTLPKLKTIQFSKAICGPNHTLLLTTDGFIYAFGENTVGQVGDGTVEHQSTPVRIREDIKFVDIITNKENDLSIAVSKSGKFYVWGLANNRRLMSPKEMSDTSGDTVFDIYVKNAKNKITFKSIEINSDSKKWQKSVEDMRSHLEESTDLNDTKDTDSLNEDIIYSNSCIRGQFAVKTGKTIEDFLTLDLFLKNKSLIDNNMKRSIRLLYVFGIYGSKVIFATKDDMVYALGHNRDGCLGIGTTDEHILSMTLNGTLSGKQLIDISSGYEHCIGMTADGRCYGWGVNKYGQLGIGNTENQTTPQLIKDLTDKHVIQISCGSYHSLALTSDGDLFSWGHNTFAQLGDRTYNSRDTPTQVLINEPIASISSGINHALALTTNGYVYLWGVNESGQLGRERQFDLRKGRDKAMSNRPKLVPGLETIIFKKAICGPNHSLLLTTDGHIYVFGDNSNGQIGNGTTDIQTCPFKLNKNIQIKDVITCFRDDLSIAVSTDNKCYVWGLVMDKKVLKPQPIPDSNGRTLFDIYVKLAKNKVTFKTVNINEDIDNYMIPLQPSIPSIPSINNLSAKRFEVNTNQIQRLNSEESLNSMNNLKNNNFNTDLNNDLDKDFNYFYERIKTFNDGLNDTLNKKVSPKTVNEVIGDNKLSNLNNLNNDLIVNGLTTSSVIAGQLFLTHLHKSFDSQTNYDLVITTGDKVIYCHKTILQIRNERFWHLLNSRMNGGDSNKIHINPDSFSSFYAFLQYIYGIEPDLDIKVVNDVKKMADYFKEPELKELCIKRFKTFTQTIDITNVCLFYEISVTQELKDLEKSCLEFAAKNWKTIIRSDAFQAMDDSLSKSLMLSIHI